MLDVSSLPPVRRGSLIDHVAQTLRTALRAGTMPNPLPGEHALSAQLGVSRPTLRAALAILSDEGFLLLAKGLRPRIKAPRPRAKQRTTPVSVCIVTPRPRSAFFPEDHPMILQLRARFAAKGITWDEVFDQRLAGPRTESRLQRLTSERPHTVSVLLASTAHMQHWFAKSSLPSIILGSCHPGVSLPSVDINYRAIGWHAAGTLLKRGHRHLALLLPMSLLAGELACREGFTAYLAQASPPASLLELATKETPQDLQIRLGQAFASANRPTAIFSLAQTHTLMTLLHLLKTGRQVPEHVSLLARDLHPLLETATPEVAHYTRPITQLLDRTFRLTQTLLAGRKIPPRQYLITPVFIAGRTLGKAPSIY